MRETGQLRSRGSSGEGSRDKEVGNRPVGRPKAYRVEINSGRVDVTLRCEEHKVQSNYEASDELNTESELKDEDHIVNKKRK